MLLCTLEVFVIGTCAASSRFVVAERCAWAPSTECGIKEAAEGAKTIPLDRPVNSQSDLSADLLPGTKVSPSILVKGSSIQARWLKVVLVTS